MAKQPSSNSEQIAIVQEQITKLLDTDTFTKEQRSLVTQLSMMIYSNTYAMARGLIAMRIQATDQSRIILMALKVCVVTLEKAMEFEALYPTKPTKPDKSC